VKSLLRRIWGWALDHPVLAVFIVALAARAVVALGIYVVHDGTMFNDDRFFFTLAHQRATGATSTWGPYEHTLFDKTTTFLWPLTALFWFTGSSVFAGQLLAAVAGAGAAGLTTAVGLRALRVEWAIAAGAVMALLPSVVLWSSLTLKDAFVWCVVAAIGLGVCELEGSTRRFAAVGAGIVVLLYALAHLRDQSTVVAVWAVTIALLLGPGRDHRRRAVFGIAVLLFAPPILGQGFGTSNITNFGVAGLSLVQQSAPQLEERRQNNEVGAASALTCDAGKAGLRGEIEHLPCGLPAVLLRPYPWETDSSTAVRLARLESLIWYPLLALSIFGLFHAWRLRRALAFPALYAGAIALVYAFTEGNIGTAFRHRAEATWGVAIFAALAAQTIVDRRARVGVTDAAEPASTLVSEHGA
jgi:hypothetical protein